MSDGDTERDLRRHERDILAVVYSFEAHRKAREARIASGRRVRSGHRT